MRDPTLWIPPRWLKWAALLAVAAIIGVMVSVSAARAAEPFTLPKPSCYFANLDYRYLLADGPDAIVWWCPIPTGLEVNYRVGEIGGIREFLFRIGGAGKDLYAADIQIFIRAANDREREVVQRIEDAGEPRCYAQGTGKSQQVYTQAQSGELGPAQTDAAAKVVYIATGMQLSCYEWITTGTKRYCLATGKDSKGRDLASGAYALCRIELAPEAGWQ